MGEITGIKVSQFPTLCICAAGAGVGVGVKLLTLVFIYARSNWTSNHKNDIAEYLTSKPTEQTMQYKN